MKYDMIYLLTKIGLSPGGSTHLHTNNTWNNTNKYSWFSFLWHSATSQKVAGSIPDGVTGIFHWHNPSGRTMVLGSTLPLTEINVRNISWGKRRPMYRADNLTTFMCRLSWNLGVSASWKPQGLSRPVQRLHDLSLLITYIKGWVDPRATVRPEVLRQWNNTMTPLGNFI
jgi:hypothetical protein